MKAKIKDRKDTYSLQTKDSEDAYAAPPVLFFYSIDGYLRPYECYQNTWMSDDTLTQPKPIPNQPLAISPPKK